MQPFDYHSGNDTRDAYANFAAGASQYLAGGTTLIDLMKLHVLTPKKLVDLTGLPLKTITEHDETIEIGALVSNNEMAHSPLIKKHFPFVSQALLSGASVQLRNLATTAGNILQKTRCPYYRDLVSKCNKRSPGSGCDALDGFNRMNAVMGVSDHCIASNPSDLNVALMACGAVINTENASGGRHIPIEKFYTLPGNTPQVETVLEPGELITSVSLPRHSLFQRSTYVKIRDRSSYAFALTSVAAAIELQGNLVKQVRLAFGGVGTVPWRAAHAEEVLIGSNLNIAKMNEAIKAETAGAVPRKYNAFKLALIGQTMIRALRELEKKS